MNLAEKVLQKMYEQWGTMRKAFMNLNQGKSGKITRTELKFYLNHWGMQVPDDAFESLFNGFDEDQDGLISYKDF